VRADPTITDPGMGASCAFRLSWPNDLVRYESGQCIEGWFGPATGR